MKKTVTMVLCGLLAVFSVGTWAHMHGDKDVAAMQALREEMHQKMSAAKTEEERQALREAQHQRMQAEHGDHGVMPMHPGMGRMPMRSMMQDHRHF